MEQNSRRSRWTVQVETPNRELLGADDVLGHVPGRREDLTPGYEVHSWAPPHRHQLDQAHMQKRTGGSGASCAALPRLLTPNMFGVPCESQVIETDDKK